MCDFNDKRSGKKGIERVETVAFPSFQCSVADTHNQLTYTTLKTALPKMAAAIFGFGLTHAPIQPQGLDKKNTIVGQVRGKAATSLNMGLAQSGHYLVGKYL